MTKKTDPAEPITIKKYANRRLYNTESSSYVTLDHLADMVKQGREFVVKDAKSGEDITRAVLTQIIFEQENKGQTLLPVPFLRQLISFYGDGLEAMVPSYLQSAMETFTRNQEAFRTEMVANSMKPGQQAMAVLDEMTRQNMNMFQNALRMFSPQGQGAGPAEPAETPPQAAGSNPDRIDELQSQLAAMQKQLDALTKK